MEIIYTKNPSFFLNISPHFCQSSLNIAPIDRSRRAGQVRLSKLEKISKYARVTYPQSGNSGNKVPLHTI